MFCSQSFFGDFQNFELSNLIGRWPLNHRPTFTPHTAKYYKFAYLAIPDHLVVLSAALMRAPPILTPYGGANFLTYSDDRMSLISILICYVFFYFLIIVL